MKRKTQHWVIAVATLVVFGCASENQSDAPPVGSIEENIISLTCAEDAVGNPAPFEWTFHEEGNYFSGTLVIEEATLTIDGETLTTRAYHQAGQPPSVPGPTIHMEPGNKYVLHFENRLPFEEFNPNHNTFRNYNTSNVHTHGLHISGESPGDDVTRNFQGGEGGDFVYDIPADHMGGTFWYHAHHHGSTWLQISGGAFGMLIIDDANDGMPANVAAMEDRELVFGLLDPTTANNLTGSPDDTLLSGTLPTTWTVNGQPGASLCMPSNEWQHWRVLVADPADAENRPVTFGPGCEVMLLARDGVWRTTTPADLPSGGNTLNLTGASRADFAVRCTADTPITVDGQTVANVVIEGVGLGEEVVSPFAADGVSQWTAVRPSYLQDLRGATVANSETVTLNGQQLTINGSQYSPLVPTFTSPTDGVQEYTLQGAANHPFHLHIYHVQAQNCAGGGEDYEDGEFYDVVAQNCDVRFDLSPLTTTPFDGRTIMHCHILEHEDLGLMGWLDVVGGEGPPTFPEVNGEPELPFAALRTLDELTCGDGNCDVATEDSCDCPEDCGEPAPSDTICDGIDEDCDGSIDEDFAAVPTVCGLGVCVASGATTCENGVEIDSCVPGDPPSPDDGICDNQDNDCDGDTDEDFVSTPTACGVGACSATGAVSCVDGIVDDTCVPGTPAAADTTCDGVDDDCDGIVDEDYVPVATACGNGVCAAIGVTSCAAGVVVDSCVPGTPPSADDAVCDGIDSDCDGAVDEDFASTPTGTTCGVGACQATGALSCVNGTVQDTCVPGTPAADDALCDGIDNDCDGATDEEYVPVASTCGVGACESVGQTSCVLGEVIDLCEPGTPETSELVCDDAIDADCDGDTDCEDADCSADPACASTTCDNDGVCEPGEDCNTCPGDCVGRTHPRTGERSCCGNGIRERGERICGGNF